MFNPRLTETLTDFPFARLNALIAPIAPPAHLSMINMSVGEPQGAMPAFARQIVNDEIDGWNRYPPNQGIPDLNVAIVEWLNRRYRLPAGLLDPMQHVIPTAGSKEGVYIISTVATPQQKAGAKPVVALPNPFYQAYLGGAVLSGAEPLLVNANAETGFLPDFDAVDEATWKRMSVVYLCSPANPQGAIAGIDYLQKLLAKCREHDAVLAVDECYAEIYTREPPPGALEAALAMDTTGGNGPVPQPRGLPFALQALQRRRPSFRLHGGRSAAGGDDAALAHLWRPADPLRRPEGVGGAVARGDASPPDARVVRQELPRRRADPAQPLRLLHAGRRLLPVARRRRRRGGDAQAVGRGAREGAARRLCLPRDGWHQHRRTLHPRRPGA